MAEFAVRRAEARDARAMAELFAAVAEERNGIATEPPVNIDERAAQLAASTAGSFVAESDGQIVGVVNLHANRHGFADLGMLVDKDWRNRGVGSALVQEAIAWAKAEGLHKLCLEVFTHNAGAIALYRKCGFVTEGLRRQQYRRASGELWDCIVMGRPV